MAMRVTHCKSASQAKGYYQHSDYYTNGPDQLKGMWSGHGATLLGLKGEVNQLHFERLVDNLHPFIDEKLTPRNHTNRRVGTDLTLSAPKSVSILWAMTQDDRILEAVQSAAHSTLGELEKDVQTRVNLARGDIRFEKSGNLVAASWLHTTARPVDGHPDPQLHMHCFVINATHTGERWTAADLSAVVADSGYYEAVFQSTLAANIQKLGFAVERNARDFEVAGINRATINKFSRRTSAIETEAEVRNITSAKAKGELGAKTRDKKTESQVPIDQLPELWRSRLTEEETDQLNRVIAGKSSPAHTSVDAATAVDYATEHLFEREAVVRERQLKRTAILRSIGAATPDQITSEVTARPFLREGEEDKALITTREVLGEEQAMLAFARSGRGELPAMAPNHSIKQDFLSSEQRAAVSGLLNSHDRLQILRGVAGAGKTTLMNEAIGAMQGTGLPVTVLAPTADTAYGVLKDKEGFDAHTLARFLVDKDLQADAAHGVIWVDEAGQASSRELARLTDLAKSLDARIVLGGDVKQHKAVARGQPLRLLETQAGIKPLEVTTIRRQKGAYRDAVMQLSLGHVSEGLEQLDALGFIQETEDDDSRARQLAKDYADAIAIGKSALVIAPSHAERNQITEAIRDELKSRGEITGKEHTVSVLSSKRLTDAEKSDPLNYLPGDVIEFSKRGKGGFQSGDKVEVTRITDTTICGNRHGKAITVPLSAASSFDVFEPKAISLAKGDVIRITKNKRPDKDTSEGRLNNGSLHTVHGFTKSGDIKLKGGKRLPAGWQHIDHGITVTSHASQGKTFDRVFVAQSSLSFGASSPEQLYVSASRGREGLTIYTDDMQGLKAAVMHARPSKLASELKPNEHQTPDTQTFNRIANAFTQLQNRARDFALQQLRRFQQWKAIEHPHLAR